MSEELTFLDLDEEPEKAPSRRGRRVGEIRLVEEDSAEAPQKARRVRVAEPFQVVHEGTVYRPRAIAEVPADLAAEWLRNQWVEEAA